MSSVFKSVIDTADIVASDIPALARKTRSNKGDYGCVGVLAGSKNMAGACYLAAKAAYSCGAGLVKMISPECNRTILQTLLPEAVLYTYDESTPVKDILAALRSCTTAVVGPGLGKSEQARQIVQAVLSHASLPLVLDADGLNLCVHTDFIQNYGATLVITPHMGEAARLLDMTVKEALATPEITLQALRDKYKCTVLLKDQPTLICKDETLYINRTGNNGMATGGSGDVLAGVVATLLRGGDGALCAAAAAYLHGRAGDLAAKKHGKHAMLASHVAAELENVLKDFTGE